MARGWEPPIDIHRDGEFNIPRPPANLIKRILIGLAAVILLWTSYYQVGAEEMAVVQRFGAFVGTSGPGLHVKVPFGIDRVTKVPVQRQLKIEFGFRSVQADVRTTYAQNTETRAESQ